ncbi:hypothetical protein PYV61_20290, partial [Roseisolibacter sp. H3M3-2]
PDAPAGAPAARARGMATLWESGAAAVRGGATSVEELLRVLDPPTVTALEAADAVDPALAAERRRRPGRGDVGALPDLDGTFELLPPVARCRPRAPAPPPA